MKYRINFNLLLFLVVISVTYGQVQKAKTIQIGNTTTNSVSSSAALQIDETTTGFLPPRLTIAQRDLILAPATGLTIFNTSTNCLEYFNGVGWYSLCKNDDFEAFSSGGTALVSAYSCSTAFSGNMTVGIAVSGVTQTITATVSTPGTYVISTNTVNGITFSGSGTFLGVGPQFVVLTASGTPTSTDGLGLTFTLDTTPNCIFTRTINPQINTPVTIPSTITLNQSSKYLVPSCYDIDYLPYAAPTTAATTVSVAAGGSNETLINKQGSITTAGVVVNIPVATTSGGTLPAYSTTITIPSSVTEDGIGRDLTLSWDQQIFTSGTKIITAKISAVGGPINVKKLDINSGIGSDYLGVLIGRFTYPYTSSALVKTTSFDVRVISFIPDRMAGIADNTGSTTSHMMFYAPIVADDGNIWLNNNLGAKYSNMNYPDIFNPIQQAISINDYNAYGSLFQWGRKPDGHELIIWNTSSSGTPVNGSTTTLNDNPTSNALFITGNLVPGDWRVTQDDNLWSSESSANNPCPKGFRVPTITEFNNFQILTGISNYYSAFNTFLKFIPNGSRYYLSGTTYNTGSTGSCYYWASTVSGTSSNYFAITETGFVLIDPLKRINGASVRCIKN
jgi:hypothetical protein